MTLKFKQSPNFVGGTNRIRFPITGNGRIRNVGSSLPGSRMPILADNYLVYYFDEPSGTTVTNYGTAAGNNLTISGTGATRSDSTIYPKGTPGTSIARTSPKTYAANTSLSSMPYSGQNATGTGWTVEITCGWSATWSGSNEGIFQGGTGAPVYSGPSIYLYRSSLTQITLAGIGYWGGNVINATVPSSTDLCHIVGIIRKRPGNNDDFLYLYVNGQAAGSAGLQFGTLPLGGFTFTHFYVGTYDSTNYTCPYGFKVGEVRVSAGVPRDATYIQQAYNNALTL